MTDLEDARQREHAAVVMYWQLCNAQDRGEPVDWLVTCAHTELIAAIEHLNRITKENQ